jgi:hypothetical protein
MRRFELSRLYGGAAPGSVYHWTATDVFRAAVAGYLVLSPFMFRFAGGVATWSAILTGVLLLVASLAKGILRDWQDWACVILGLWAMVAPWLLGFSDQPNAAGMHVCAGLVAIVASGIQIWTAYLDSTAPTA